MIEITSVFEKTLILPKLASRRYISGILRKVTKILL